MKMKRVLFLLAALLSLSTNAFCQDPNFYIFLCLGQSNMEGFPGIEPQDKATVDKRFQVLAAVDFPALGRTRGNWYPAVPPLCRRSTGLCPADFFGRTMVANLPEKIRVGVINVSVAGCKIELFDKDNYQTYASTAPSWMTNIIKEYNGNPYAHLVEMAKLAQKEGVIKGILLHQGESNTNDKQWPAKVKGIYDNLIKDLNLKAESVPLLAGELVNADQQGACASMNSIIAGLPRTIPNSYVISSQACTSRPDHLHFNPAGYRELGRRYAVQMLSLLGYKLTEPTASGQNPPLTVDVAAPGGNVSPTSESEWIALFNGKDLSGWTIKCQPQDQGKVFWTVADGTILCDSMGRKDHNYVWLLTEKEFGDFELRLQFQAYRNSPGNSGLQFHSRFDETANGGWLDGPQVDIHPPESMSWRTGLLYDETRGEQRWISPSLKNATMDPRFKPPSYVFKYADDGDGWNDLVVICRGTHVKTILNGVVRTDWDGVGVLDNTSHVQHNVGQVGHFALQLHTGDQLRIRFRDIRIRSL
jgi:hypothetical protein